MGDRAVLREGDFMQHVIAHGVHPEPADEVVGVNDVAERLGHFAVADQQPWVPEHLLGQRFAECHQEDRPIDGMETDNILADQVYVGGPEALVMLVVCAVGVVAAEGDIVGKRVQPNVGDMLIVEVDRHAPVERGARHAQVLEPRFQEVVDHFVLRLSGWMKLGCSSMCFISWPAYLLIRKK